MALLKTKQNTKEVVAIAPVAVAASASSAKHPTSVILKPLVSEKAVFLADQGAYVFLIAPSATKTEVSLAINALFNVKPRAVRVVRTKGKQVFNRRSRTVGRTAATKKAIVFLKKGETIEMA